MLRLFKKTIDSKLLNDMFQLKEKNYKIMINTGPFLYITLKLAVILDTVAKPNVFRKDKITSFLKTKVVRLSETTRAHAGNDRSFRIVGNIKL